MRKVPVATSPLRGDKVFRTPGLSYLPKFVSAEEAEALAAFFSKLKPLWESRYANGKSARGGTGRLTRPVYWLGAWQFAALGYYSEPDHLDNRCVRGEPLPPVMWQILQRARSEMVLHGDEGPLPNTCLINYYGRTAKQPGQPPVDYARLRAHRDAEPGAVMSLSIGQPAQFEFVEPEAEAPHHAQWLRHRSVVVLSGPVYKDQLYHRITRVRYGQDPVLSSRLEDFEVRRINVSFRHVPERYIQDLSELSDEARAIAQPYVEQLAEHSAHYRAQLAAVQTVDGS
jgi:alkylated DNA repair protein (DNA oxidative demethylase)